MSERNQQQDEVAVETGRRRRRRLGPRPTPPSLWGTDTSDRGLGINPTPPSQWAPPVAGGSLGFGGATADRTAAQAVADAAALSIASERDRRASAGIRGSNLEARARPPFVPPEEPAVPTFGDFISGFQFDPSPYAFDSTAYDNYINFLMERDAETEARIRAMYAELGESADANVQRITDIYNTGTANLGDIYSSAAQGTQDAYASAQQQAADQMARLGIEAAAPTVLDPMAMSQAGALSGIEAQRASGLGATQQYGMTAQDFSSQMQQVAQQEGLEVTSSIMARAAERQAEAAFMREQARAQADREMRQAQAAYNPYARAMQQMEAEQAWNLMQNGDPMAMVEEMRIAQDRALSMQDRYIKLVQHYEKLDLQERGRINREPGQTPEERAMQMLQLAGSDQLYPLPMF
jgi:hypothetical protein